MYDKALQNASKDEVIEAKNEFRKKMYGSLRKCTSKRETSEYNKNFGMLPSSAKNIKL